MSDQTLLGQVLLHSGPGVAARARACALGLAQLEDSSVAERVELAVSEIIQNIWRHAYQGRNRGPIKLSVYDRSDGIEIQIEDRGVALSNEPVGRENSAELLPGGRGIMLVRSVANQYEYRPNPQGAGALQVLVFERGLTT
ncbi:MAG: ATP-binding protein [Litorivicinus sp.]